MKELIKFIKSNEIGNIEENVSLKKYTSFKTGGKAKLIVLPKDDFSLILLLKEIKKLKLKYKILGNGSNLIFSSNEYKDVLIKLDHLNKVEYDNRVISVGSGYSLIKLSLEAAKKGLKGLEFAAGIPGSIGGAVYMNAGAYNSDMSNIIKEVKVINENFEIITIKKKDMAFKYRKSLLQDNKNLICISVTIKLETSDSKELIKLIQDRTKRRKTDQPLNYPSAGSVFRNPPGMFSGKLIEDLGLKGYKVNDAEVSKKHANFIINKGNASGEDIYILKNHIHDLVKENYNINLICEQEFVNF